MNRRKMLSLIPASIAGFTAATKASATENLRDNLAPREPFAIQYINAVRDHFKQIRYTQADNLMEGAYAMARTIENGGSCWQIWDAGHTNADIYPDRQGLPAIFSGGYNAEQVKDGDLVLARNAAARYTEDFAKKDLFIIGAPSPWSGDALRPELLNDEVRRLQLWPYADVWIETGADVLDHKVKIPGMNAGFGPVTGADGPLMMWMMVADACRILARKGITLPVYGDEPVLGDRAPGFSGWTRLNSPIMGEYYNEVMHQMELIGAELGTLRRIATMALNAHLDGGRIYVYSRYASLAQDANTRRSGISITRGIMERNGNLWDGQLSRVFEGGTAKDFVLIGTLQPDDPFDLKTLDYFRKRKMKIASMGPMTRGLALPEGRAVYKETEVHMGRMCDTYGIFPIRGFERRVCPTSGILLNQMFWALNLELVDQYITRTGGDIPGSFFSAGLKGGRERFRRWYNLDQQNF